MAEILLEVKDLKKYFKAGSKIQLFWIPERPRWNRIM